MTTRKQELIDQAFEAAGIWAYVFILYIFTVVGLSIAGWIYSRRVQNQRLKIFYRSGIVSAVCAPTLLFAGHGAVPLPAFIAIFAYLATPYKVFALYWGIVPIIVTWVIVFMVWISIHEIRRIWKQRRSDT